MDIAGRISNRKEGERLKTLLEIPKNKKWIGSRFHKLLLKIIGSDNKSLTFTMEFRNI